jgi:hypothetical protein
MDKVNMARNKNRRVSFRIYDEVNLFYQKVDEKLLTEPQPAIDNVLNVPAWATDIERGAANQVLGLSGLERKLPDVMMADFQFNEHETFDVNISATGMAFNSEDALKEGDYLVIKILLSSMAEIVTYGQVVYCNANQVNDSQYPYFIGAHFIYMEDESKGLLNKHLERKRAQQRWINGFILAAAITVIGAPATVFGLLLELLHFLLEVFLHGLHLAFEFIESNLDHLVEHLFETDVHETQIIVFYTIVPFVLYGLYRLLRAIPPFCRWCKKKQIAYWSRKKARLLFYWREQSLFNKIKLVALGAAAIVGYFFLGI